ncbi:hypothetical protein BKE30_01150 [Alkanindiges hydrocarboniclasticus]|uniref:Uncharacterized protein n=1 Tax=Alkanindiges hydrocarboniclasticus TaxID=1907941 RepID=A0A1S8CXQ4_9GAMM|nr:hypothetical protein [Alkanindiges hydrocarboniclasticus]ONG42140.1 hypothetical protein BKE30_01150 [Alkanindiges hydrocarboniclasticus]
MNKTQLEIAKHQLDKSIELLIDEEDYICALTLAGAAEGILAGFNPDIFNFVRDKAAEKFDNTPKEIANSFNEFRNLLKHGSADILTKRIEIDAFEAAFMIQRAIAILSYIPNEEASVHVLKFKDWLEFNKVFECVEDN